MCLRPLCTNLFKGDHSDQTPDAGDVRVIQAQQREDGVSLPGRERETYIDIYRQRPRERQIKRQRKSETEREDCVGLPGRER